jgi:MoaA/NifB/PqqE/SkfB family radical SAM enzyme
MTYPHPNGAAWHNRDIVVPRYTEIKDVIQSVLAKYHKFLATEAIPLCYLYPYQDKVFNFDSMLIDPDKRPGIDPANKNLGFFDEEGFTDDYSVSQLGDKRKGPRCKDCVFNDTCVGVWKEYVQVHKDKFDLFPITEIKEVCKSIEEMSPEELAGQSSCKPEPTIEYDEDDEINREWGAVIIYGDNTICQNRCTFCSGQNPGLEPYGNNPETKFNSHIDEINHFLNKGVKQIEISGGDPGEYSRIADIVRYITDNGVERVQLSTHGRTLCNEDLVVALAAAGLTEVRIPLYGSTAEIHNKTVQYEPTPGNAFEETLAGIKNCAKHGIKIVGHTLMNQYNKEDMNNIIQLYLDASNELMDNIYVGITFISSLDYEYTNTWYLPVKDLGPYMTEVYKNHPKIPDHIRFTLLDIPYCVLGEYTDIIENEFQGFPDLGLHKVEEENRSADNDGIPHYRIKSYFGECKDCIHRPICGAIPLNEIKMFGTYGLKAIKE